MTRPRLLVVAIYAPSEWNRSWYALQQKYLRATCTDVDLDFRVYLNGVDEASVGEGLVVAGSSPQNDGHSAALRAVVDLFRRSDHDYFLILDSDCFPVRDGWFTILVAQMARFRKRFAAPVRTENLDVFPHPSAFFLTGGAARDPRINFDLGHTEPNLLGEPVGDAGSAMQSMMCDVLPLLRTNMRNRHPIGGALYHHLFYHHGAGSRTVRYRLTHRYDYSGHWWDAGNDQIVAETMTRELFADPEAYLNSLKNP